MASKKPDFIKVMTPKFRVSFPNVFRPKAVKEGDEPKYSISMLFDKEAQASKEFKAMKKAALDAREAFFGKNLSEKVLKKLRNPFRDAGEKSEFEGYEDGIIFVSSNSKMKPGLVDRKNNDIIAEEDFYAGCYARATLLCFGYDTMGNKGVAFLLSNIQKLADGEQISGKTKASDDFDALEGDDEDNFDLDDKEDSTSDDW